MRKRLFGSIAALVAGAGVAWGQAPMPVAPSGGPPAPASIGGAEIIPAQGVAPTIMPPVTVGPPGDPLGLGPTASLGPPPGPMWPPPGPYTAPMFQPPPPSPDGPGGTGYGTAPKWWFNGEYLLYFPDDQPVPFPLLTTSAPNQNGLLGNPSTLQLVNGDDISYSSVSGFRLGTGFYGDADRRFGMEVSGFYTMTKTIAQSYSATPVGIPLLARPFIDTTNGPTSLVTASPTLGGGNAIVSVSTSTWGVEANALWNMYRSSPGTKCWNTFDVMLGYRFLENRENFVIGTTTNLTGVTVTPIFRPGPFGVPVAVGFAVTPIPVPVGGVVTGAPAMIQIIDRISTSNRFNGLNVGFHHELRYGMFSLATTAKLGVGNMHQVLNIQGTTTFVNPAAGNAAGAFGGLYANAQNIGVYDNDEFAVIPEINMSLGVNLTKRLTVSVGYNFLYINKVLRPGNHLNPVIDQSVVPFSPRYGATGQVPGTNIGLIQDDFYLKGVNFSMLYRY